MATFDPGPITEPRTFRFCCTGPGGTVYTQPFTVTPSADCAAVPCQILASPQNQTGPLGTPIPPNMGGSHTGAVQWQFSASPSGPWTNLATPPTQITGFVNGFYYRFCCVDDPSNCSGVALITMTTSGGDARLTSTDPDGVWDTTQPTDPTETFCLEDCATASYLWEVRVLDPDPNDPQAFVSATGWQPVDFGGAAPPQCFTMTAPNQDAILAAQGFDPNTATGLADLTQTLYFEIRGTCDGQSFTDTVTIEYFHTDDPELP